VNVACQGNFSLCHFELACLRFASPGIDSVQGKSVTTDTVDIDSKFLRNLGKYLPMEAVSFQINIKC